MSQAERMHRSWAVATVGAVLMVGASAAGSEPTAPLPHVQATVRVGSQPTWLAAGDAAVWVASYGDSSVSRIDPRRNRVGARIALPGSPYGVAFGAGSVWVSSFDTSAVTRIDPNTNRIVARIDVGASQQAGITATDDAVWVAIFGSGSVVRIDPATNLVVSRIQVGGSPEDAVQAALARARGRQRVGRESGIRTVVRVAGG